MHVMRVGYGGLWGFFGFSLFFSTHAGKPEKCTIHISLVVEHFLGNVM